MRTGALILLLAGAIPALAQHDITKVDPVQPGDAIATPTPIGQERRMKRYDVPDLAGAKQALGSQLIDGRLPKPMIDFIIRDANVDQRISLFEGGLVVVRMSGGASIRKKVLIPADALGAYIRSTSKESLDAIDQRLLPRPDHDSRAVVRAYAADGSWSERTFNPETMIPWELEAIVAPLRDLLRAISEDRTVTSSVAGYEPKEGDELVADDHKSYRVARVRDDVVELHCLDAPTTIYVSKKDLYLYFVGAKPH